MERIQILSILTIKFIIFIYNWAHSDRNLLNTFEYICRSQIKLNDIKLQNRQLTWIVSNPNNPPWMILNPNNSQCHPTPSVTHGNPSHRIMSKSSRDWFASSSSLWNDQIQTLESTHPSQWSVRTARRSYTVAHFHTVTILLLICHRMWGNLSNT